MTANRVWRKLKQPIGWLHAPEGRPERDRFVIVSGHLDSWNPGVTDNITGNAVMLEIARGLAQQRHTLRRSVVFCFWNGHEVAEATGSTCFVDKHWERISRGAVAYFNIDSVGMKGTTEFQINTCPELAQFSAALADRCFGDSLPIRVSDLRRVGDQSFFGNGVSAATGRHIYSEEVVAAQNGATLGWYNHTEFDTVDVLDEAVLAGDLQWCSAFVAELCGTKALPHRMSDRLDDLKRRFDKALNVRSDPADLHHIPPALEELSVHAAWLDEHLERLGETPSEGDLRRANTIVLRLSRLLTFLTGSACGKYGQDSYGISTLMHPVPRLAGLERYQKLDPDSLEARLLKTELIRRRHEISDALDAAIALLSDFRALYEAGA